MCSQEIPNPIISKWNSGVNRQIGEFSIENFGDWQSLMALCTIDFHNFDKQGVNLLVREAKHSLNGRLLYGGICSKTLLRKSS